MPKPLPSQFRRLLLLLLVAYLFFGLGLVGMGFAFIRRSVGLEIDGRYYRLETRASTVGNLLGQAGVGLAPEDLVEPAPGSPIREGMRIRVTRAIPVTVWLAGEPQVVMVSIPTVASVLDRAGIILGQEDLVDTNLYEGAAKGLYLKVARVATVRREEETPLLPPVVRKPAPNLPRGLNRVLEEGQPGLSRREVEVRLVDGKEVGKRLLSEEVIEEPKPRVVAFGVGDARIMAVARGQSRPERFKQELVMEATAYTHTGKPTATGAYPGLGSIAVDPRVIPLGTRMYVEGYGYGVAQDTGGAIKGNKVDVFMESRDQAMQWGRRQVKVLVLAD